MAALFAQQPHLEAGYARRRRAVHCRAAVAQRLPVLTHTLPNGFSIRHTASPAEVSFLYHEQYIQQVYLQHGVCIHDGDVVLDVGANAGLFSMFAAEVGVHAFTPHQFDQFAQVCT